jgi:hypothetical protein
MEKGERSSAIAGGSPQDDLQTCSAHYHVSQDKPFGFHARPETNAETG